MSKNKEIVLTLKMPSPSSSLIAEKPAGAVDVFVENSPCSASSTTPSSPHDFIERLAEIMTDPAVRSFFNDYFKTWSDGQACLMLMHAYNVIDETYARKNGGARLTSDQIVPLVRRAVSNADCRKVLCTAMQRYISDDVSVFANILQQETIEQTQPQGTIS